MAQDDSLFLVFFVLALSYTSILIYTALRSLNLRYFTASWKDAKFLYYFQLLELFLRTTSFWFICMLNNELNLDNTDLAFIMLSLPESLIISCFIILFWILLTANILTRFNSTSHFDSSGLIKTNKNSFQWVQKLTKYFLFAWVFLDTVLYILMFCGVLRPLDIVIQHSVLCFFISVIVLTGVGVIQCKSSGIPFISEEAQLTMKKVLVVVFVWSLGRIVHGILYLIREQDLINEDSNLSGISVESPVPMIILICDLLVTEVLCFIFVVDYSFFKIFLKEIDDFPKVPLMEPLTPLEFSQPKLNLYAKDSEITLDHALSSLPHKLGVLYKGEYLSREAVIRKIVIPRLNAYIIEKLYEDLNILSTVICPHFLAPLALLIHNDTIEIVYPYIPAGSLYTLLENNYQNVSYMQKLKIAREIAFCFKVFHDLGLVHGHLTSHNILVDSYSTALVTDLGLDHLKKYCGITAGYINKSSWTSPNLLGEGGDVVSKCSKSDDVYSFGVVLWEIMTGEKPFPHISLKQLRKMINEGYRPGIPKNASKDITELLKSCWNIDASRRPNFELIFNTLCIIEVGEEGESFYSAAT